MQKNPSPPPFFFRGLLLAICFSTSRRAGFPVPLMLVLLHSKALVVIAFQLEELLKMNLAVNLAFERSILADRQRLVAGGTPQASLVEYEPFGSTYDVRRSCRRQQNRE